MTNTHKPVSGQDSLIPSHGEPLTPIVVEGVDDEPVESNRRQYAGWMLRSVTLLAILYSAFHLYVLNISPMESWSFRIVHVNRRTDSGLSVLLRYALCYRRRHPSSSTLDQFRRPGVDDSCHLRTGADRCDVPPDAERHHAHDARTGVLALWLATAGSDRAGHYSQLVSPP